MLLILVFAASTLSVLGLANAISKPSAPEFTVRYIDNSYDVPATYDKNPYTGENVVTQEGRYVQQKTIEVTIKTPAFTPYTDQSNHAIGLYYSIRMRGHFEGSWFYLDNGYYGPDIHYIEIDTKSEYTTFTYGLVGNNGTNGLRCVDIPEGGKADIQVQAFIGYNVKASEGMTVFGEVYHYVFTGESSEWSAIQTITVHNGEAATSQQPTPMPFQSNSNSAAESSVTPQKPNPQPDNGLQVGWEQGAIVAMAVVIAALAVALVLSRRKKQ